MGTREPFRNRKRYKISLSPIDGSLNPIQPNSSCMSHMDQVDPFATTVPRKPGYERAVQIVANLAQIAPTWTSAHNKTQRASLGFSQVTYLAVESVELAFEVTA